MKKNNFFKIAILSSFIANVYANEDINTLQNISYNDNGNKFRIVLDFANPQNMSSVKINPSGENLLLHVDNVSYKLFNDSFDTNSKIVKNIKINEKDKDLEMIISLSEMLTSDAKSSGNKSGISTD